MFPVSVITVGLSNSVREALSREIANQPAQLENEFLDRAQLVETISRSKNSKPRLIINQCKSIEDLEELQKLREQFPWWPILTLTDVSLESSDLLKVNRAGATQIVPFPLAPEDFFQAMNTIAIQYSDTPMEKHLISVTGSSGGTGSTTLAIHLADEIASVKHRPVLLAELSFNMGMLATYLDVEPRFTLNDVFDDIDRLDPYLLKNVLTHVMDNLDILAGPQQLSSPLKVGLKDLLKVINYCQRLANVVILDVPCTYNEMQFEILARSDKVILIGEQTIPSIRSVKLVRDMFSQRHVETELFIVINKYNAKLEGFTAIDLQKILNVPKINTITADPTGLLAAANHGKPLRQVAPNSPVLGDITKLTDQLLGVAPVDYSPTNKSGIFNRLVKAFKG